MSEARARRPTTTHRHRGLPALLACWLIVFAALALSHAAATPERHRVVGVGDVHGDFDALVGILQRAQLIDPHLRWTGGRATLVQTGDLLDRGPRSREVLDLLMSLERQARKEGGQVIALLGNHEVMNLVGDLRYVSAEEYASYADARSEHRRREAYQRTVSHLRRRAQARQLPPPALTPESEKEWMEKHPLGYLEHREAFGPRGKYGRWLRERPALAQVGGVVFLHGGLSPQLASLNLEAINHRIRGEVKAFDDFREYFLRRDLILPFFTLEEIVAAVREELEASRMSIEQRSQLATQAGKTFQPTAEEKQHLRRLEDFLGFPNWLSHHPEGPLWFRGFAEWSEEEGAAQIEDLLSAYGATAFVVGHTPQSSGQVGARFEGRIFLIDTGMLSRYYPGGQASALELNQGTFTAIYPEQRVVLHPLPANPAPAGEGAPGAPVEHPGGAPAPGPAQVSSLPLSPPPSAAPAHVWLDPDGKPLPFANDDEVKEFLRTARVRRTWEIREGITRPRRVLLEKDGLRMHAIYHDIDEAKPLMKFATGATEVGFRDTYLFQAAAYELARLLGLDTVPPTIVRRIGRNSGSLQAWVEKAMTEGRRIKNKIKPPDVIRWNHELYRMHVFDALIYNTDRNLGNVLIDKDWKVWMVDHTRAFRVHPDPKELQAIRRCERALWEKLRNLDEQSLRSRLKPFLRGGEIKALLTRRQKLVEHIQRLIDERGEENVLYTLE